MRAVTVEKRHFADPVAADQRHSIGRVRARALYNLPAGSASLRVSFVSVCARHVDVENDLYVGSVASVIQPAGPTKVLRLDEWTFVRREEKNCRGASSDDAELLEKTLSYNGEISMLSSRDARRVIESLAE